MAFIIIVAAAGAGCGYYSTSSRTAKDIKTIAVPFFENRTAEPNLEIAVTDRIIANLVADNTLKVVDERDADAVLQGVIRQYQNRPFSFNQELDAEEYHVIIDLDVTLYSSKTNEAIWEKKGMQGIGSYFIDAAAGEFTIDEAIDRAILELTNRILNLTVQDW